MFKKAANSRLFIFYLTFILGICYILIMKYLTVIHKSKYGYDVHVPALPGCHSQGDTEKEAIENIQDAILTYLEMGKEDLKGAKVKEVEVAFA